jgi:DNA polymerase I-like protein with 3'-5' exonuclease and polymerase domains
MLTLDDLKNLPDEEQEKLYKSLVGLRKKAKVVTYSAMYGIGAGKLARQLEMPQAEAQKLLDGFWKLNWAVKEVTSKAKIKLMGNSMWVYNPVSGFWIQLRSEKDTWSSLNQSTGVYCFDTWLSFCRQAKIKIAMQFHDEVGFYVPEVTSEYIGSVLKGAIKKANDKLNLNVLLDVDVQVGKDYSQTH